MDNVKRKCQACSKIFDRKFLNKITYSKKDKKLFLNPDSSIFGHSVYVCRDAQCIKEILKRKVIQKKFSKFTLTNLDFILEQLENIC